MHVIIDFLKHLNYSELVGALFGVAGIWLTVKEKIWCFPVGLVNVIITAYLVYTQHLYADTLQQVVYFILLIIGWFNWSRKNLTHTVKISFLSIRQIGITFFTFIAGSSLLYLLLKNYTDASLPLADSTGTIISFIAQYLIARKKIENWLLWILVNIMYIWIFWIKGMPLYTALSYIYLFQSFVGWFDWKRKLRVEGWNYKL